MNAFFPLPLQFHRLPLAGGALLLLLQRTPLLRFAATAQDPAQTARASAMLVTSLTATALLGPVHTVAGATTLVFAPSAIIDATVGKPVAVAVSISQGGGWTPWEISNTLPPGLVAGYGGPPVGTVQGNLIVGEGPIPLIIGGTPAVAGSFVVSVRATYGSPLTGSVTFRVTGESITAPIFTAQPADRTAAPDTSSTLQAVATGDPRFPISYQWRKDGQTLARATNASFTLARVAAADAGTYTVVASNSAGSVMSHRAVLTVIGGTLAAPVIEVSPSSLHVARGDRASLALAARGGSLAYQWKKDGHDLAGATAPTLTFTAAAPADMGIYSARVSNAAGSAETTAAALTVETGGRSRLANVSTRGLVPAGGALTPGFVLRGTGQKQILVRAAGPSLARFGIAQALGNPQFELWRSGGAAILTNDNWEGEARSTILAARTAAVGAFPLESSSHDAAAFTTVGSVSSAAFTVRVTSRDPADSGIVLAEVYDADALGAAVQIVNVSTLGQVGLGAEALVSGFVIQGTAAKELLIRAVGPGLSAFGVANALSRPQLVLTPLGQSASLVSNDGWRNSYLLMEAEYRAGAFPLRFDSKDAAVLVRLPPGGYTITVTGGAATTGTALLEIYDLDP